MPAPFCKLYLFIDSGIFEQSVKAAFVCPTELQYHLIVLQYQIKQHLVIFLKSIRRISETNLLLTLTQKNC